MPILKLEIDKYLQRRSKQFLVNVERVSLPLENGEVILSITNDGENWTSIQLRQQEIRQVIDKLKAAIL